MAQIFLYPDQGHDEGDDVAEPSENPRWLAIASCRDHDTTIFYPSRGEPNTKAKAICKQCPVRIDCLDYALEQGERFGVWGGKSERERRALRRAMPKKPRTSPFPHGTPAGYARHLRAKLPPCHACREAHRLRYQDRGQRQRRGIA